MKYSDMLDIIKKREYLTHYLKINHRKLDEYIIKQMCDSIVQYDILIKKLRALNYKLLFMKVTPFEVSKYIKKEPISYEYNPETIEVIKEAISIISDKKCYKIDEKPSLSSDTISDINLIEFSKEAFVNIYPFSDDKSSTIFDNHKVFVYTKSLLYSISLKDPCIGQMFYDYYNNVPYILIEKTNTINDIYTLIHEAMHAYHLLKTDHENNYEFSEIIAQSTAFYVNDYLKQYDSLRNEALIKEDLTQDIIIYRVKQFVEYLDKNDKYSENNIVVYQKILNKLLPYTIYLRQKNDNNLNVTKNLIYVSGNNNLLDFDYRKVGINYSDIITSAKMLKK